MPKTEKKVFSRCGITVCASWKHALLLLLPLALMGVLLPDRPALDAPAPSLMQGFPHFALAALAGLLAVATGRLFRRAGMAPKVQAVILWLVFGWVFFQAGFWSGLYMSVYRQYRVREINRRTFFMDRQSESHIDDPTCPENRPGNEAIRVR